MAEQEYFKKALQNFTHDVASGGAIRHLADMGYTVKQIKEQIAFPTTYERVQETVWNHFLDTHILLLEEPGRGKKRQQVTYVVDHDQYGRTSFRQVPVSLESDSLICWREVPFNGSGQGGLAAFLARKCEREENAAYCSCDFGLRSRREPLNLQALDSGQKEYILGLPWERKQVYHRLDRRMREIIVRLYEAGQYHGNCYFMKSGEKVVISYPDISWQTENESHER